MVREGNELQAGLWELLITEELRERLGSVPLVVDQSELRNAEAADRLSRHLGSVVRRRIQDLPEERRAAEGTALIRELITHLGQDPDRPIGEVLYGLLERDPAGRVRSISRPLTPLIDSTLLTNAPGEPALAHELEAEIASAQAIDVVMAFIRRSGILPLMKALRRHCAEGRPLRILTTTYTNSTEARALDDLTDLGADVRVSYDVSMTRLHAKAWVFHRAESTTTAYLGSSNLTFSAQQTGLEWNVRLAAARNPDVIEKMMAVFNVYWAGRDFVAYDRDEFLRRTATDEPESGLQFSLGVKLRPYQEAMLEQIDVARQQGHHRNLLVAATGTGKTVMAAVDYLRLYRRLDRARLLFVAHREEILNQSRTTYAHALSDPSFGELWVRGQRPTRFEHVFASIQSLASADLSNLPADHFDVVVVDEFHHAEAPTYRRLLDHVRPVELLGLTATPERADGLDVVARFDGRIAAELRLWDAINGGYLSPFAYYGISDGTDLTAVPWRRGRGYDPAALTDVLTADHAWAQLVIEEVGRKVTRPEKMRAIGFCVSVAHAQFMAARFAAAGFSAVALSGASSPQDRQAGLKGLADGSINVVFTVDLFNEGVDVPDVDTLLLLRPTESGTLFLQQLGRGLRRAEGKAVCTVLDFIGNQHVEFRYDLRFRAFLGGVSRRAAESAIEEGFPFLPAGCSAELDPYAQQAILRSIRDSLPTTKAARVRELRDLGDVHLSTFLQESGLDLEDVCDAKGRSWTQLRVDAGLPVAEPAADDGPLLRAAGRLTHVDDADRLETYRTLMTSEDRPDFEDLPIREQRLARMLLGSLSDLPLSASLSQAARQLWSHPRARAEFTEILDVLPSRVSHVGADLGLSKDIPLRVHARYTRVEILAALGVGSGLKAPTWQEGVRWLPEVPADVLAITLDKTKGAFSPTTRYRDYALSPDLIHWESQSATSVSSPTGQRYLHHAERGSAVILFARLDVESRAFWCLGPATYVSHEGDRPIGITWKLHHRLPAHLFTQFAAAAA